MCINEEEGCTERKKIHESQRMSQSEIKKKKEERRKKEKQSRQRREKGEIEGKHEKWIRSKIIMIDGEQCVYNVIV
jgi:hypothetical protein